MASVTITKALFPSTIFLLVTIFSTSLYFASCSSDEVDALLKWKATLHSQDNNTLLPSWANDQKTVSPCNWYGLSCNENGSINRLNLSSSGLNGTLNYFSFNSFPNLMYFDLMFNNFSGIIPSDIGHLSKLVFLDFSVNQFTGKIPPEIGTLMSLERLELQLNNLTGQIPRSLGYKKHIRTDFVKEIHNIMNKFPTTKYYRIITKSSKLRKLRLWNVVFDDEVDFADYESIVMDFGWTVLDEHFADWVACLLKS
ncbi:protein kinase-like domain-containing protein [Artemisia annua]|uniref:Protein kinase-like domain-containing protein n=1 Tax=Artemisia annua TaxID=35608 RepID=A0A2U1KX70_ARTAN|nr:protein kinase-like domain-containing protein [Artemisia annua]